MILIKYKLLTLRHYLNLEDNYILYIIYKILNRKSIERRTNVSIVVNQSNHFIIILYYSCYVSLY